MKINFDTLHNDLKSSLQTTQNSDSMFLNTNYYPRHVNVNSQKLIKSKTNSGYQSYKHQGHLNLFNRKRASMFSSQIAQSETNNFNSDDFSNNQKPKKFKNIKTIQEMQSFIKAMEQSQNQEPKFGFFNDKTQNTNLNKTMESISISKLSKISSQKIQAITSRLYGRAQRANNESRIFCNRKTCKQILSTRERHLVEDLKHFTGHPKNYTQKNKNRYNKLHRSLDISLDQIADQYTQSSPRLNRNVYERLYVESKARIVQKEKLNQEFNKKCIQLSNSLQNKKNLTLEQASYLKNYRGFYERLDQLIEWQHNKEKVYEQVDFPRSKTMIQSLNKRHHRNATNSKMKSEILEQISQKIAILSKSTIECSKPKCQELKLKIKEEINQSQQIFKLGDKTIEIAQNHEKKLLQKLKGFFYDRKNQKVRINSRKISQLSEKEFSILFELIRKIEKRQQKIKSQAKLEEIILKFYQNLGFAEKQQLKRMDILSGCRIKEKRNKRISEHIKTKQSNKIQVKQHDFDPERDYCAKLALFV